RPGGCGVGVPPTPQRARRPPGHLRMPTLRNLPGLARIDGLALFDKVLHPAEHSNPSVTVALRLREVAGESFMPDFHERACADLVRSPGLQAVNLAALQLPAHYRCHRGRVACNPGVNQ